MAFENNEVGLREANDEDEIDRAKPNKIADNDPVDHDDERPDYLDASTEEEKVWPGTDGNQNSEEVLGAAHLWYNNLEDPGNDDEDATNEEYYS